MTAKEEELESQVCLIGSVLTARCLISFRSSKEKSDDNAAPEHHRFAYSHTYHVWSR